MKGEGEGEAERTALSVPEVILLDAEAVRGSPPFRVMREVS